MLIRKIRKIKKKNLFCFSEDISQLRQESTETLENTRKTDNLLKDFNVTLYTFFATKEELLITAKLHNIQASENVTIIRISELTNQLKELQSSTVKHFLEKKPNFSNNFW
jgi:hypothetical protein